MSIIRKTDWLYRQLYERILSMPEGAPFPPLRALMTEYGVSQATASPVLSMLKRRRLLIAEPRRGMFVNHRSAQKTILLLQPDWDGAALTAMVPHLRREAERRGFVLRRRLFDYHDDFSRHLDDPEADLVVADSVIAAEQFAPEQLLRVTQSSMPVVLLRNGARVSQIRYVTGDDAASGLLAARFFERRGHRRVGLLYCEPHLSTPDTLARHFQFGAATCGMEVDLLDCRMRPGDMPDEAIRDFARRFADGRYGFTALFAISDRGALVALHAFEAAGVAIPERLGLLGYGDSPEPGRERLDTIDIPFARLAAETLSMAERLLAGESDGKTQVDVMPALVERGSVAARSIPQSQAEAAVV